MRHSYETASMKKGEESIIVAVCSCGRTRVLDLSGSMAHWLYVKDCKEHEECLRDDEDEDLLRPIQGFAPHE